MSSGYATAARRPQWLTVYQLPAHAPELNPVERMQYRPGLIDGFLARSGFISHLRNLHVRRSFLALVIPAQAERVPGWIQQHPAAVLRLELSDPRAQGHGIGDGRVEIGHLDVEAHHRALLARCRGPDRRQ
jgi:hypothetical protein